MSFHLPVDAAQLRRELIEQRIIVPGDGQWRPTRLLGRVHVGLELDEAARCAAARHIREGEFGRREMQPPWSRGGR